MSKAKKVSTVDPINLPRRLREGLGKANDLLDENKAKEALEILKELDERYPNQVYVLEMLVDAYASLQDERSYLSATRRLHRLAPNRADVKLSLGGAYMANVFPALALETFREFLKRWPQHEEANKVRTMVQQLEAELPKMLAESGLDFEADFAFACQHEEAMVCLETGEFSRAKSLIEKMQRQKPDFVAPLNNLSQIYWLEGDLPRAIETSRRVLAIQPDNLHAQANLIRYLYLTGQREAAAPLIERLKASTAKAADRWKKLAETLAFIGDDQGMLE
ncbi:MAG: tetratricopeptide repeat protein, partial [Anaerolineae bacterium]